MYYYIPNGFSLPFGVYLYCFSTYLVFFERTNCTKNRLLATIYPDGFYGYVLPTFGVSTP